MPSMAFYCGDDTYRIIQILKDKKINVSEFICKALQIAYDNYSKEIMEKIDKIQTGEIKDWWDNISISDYKALIGNGVTEYIRGLVTDTLKKEHNCDDAEIEKLKDYLAKKYINQEG